MRIARVRVSIVRIRRRVELVTAYGTMPESTIVLVEVETDDGLTGLGQSTASAPWYGESAEAMRAHLTHYLVPAVLGEDPTNIEGLVRRMDRALPGALYAKSALEVALWDLKGQATGLPVYQLLGGRVQEGIRLHGFVHHGTPEAMAERARQEVARGWTMIKMKIGMEPTEDLVRYRAVREAVGDRARFQVDGNTGYTLTEAVVTLRAMERLGGVAIFEQPVRTTDAMAHLAMTLETPLMADESLETPHDALTIARTGAARVLHLKLHKFGGLLKAKRIAAIAEAAEMQVSVAPYTDVELAAAAHFAASTPNALWPTGFTPMEDSILATPLEPVGQRVRPGDAPGLGVTLDRDRLEALVVA
ncbi:MAG: enolase C-terminal domain-like protein [Armatimonadota bacterium]|nr:enolase C-terminal domain-like protein [Armatimonadota bacterium]MDR7528322.1 enolase C-terminal domain-like protein [Armatimonadota bacterium]MDR7543715.1 enolase C-terminal domain-like protein [Armatimonadota bacterium]MDR7573761.1 enolase C-terminal domain-like protein [Armatimonadota bacterium]MDR7584683.1 enolase C-terminal domain-like protein [Armatimonadota bacterium]